MSTKNIECQLAQGQIGRYLNGERFNDQAIKQLEAHVADCDECSELVTRRRQALLTMLGERNNNLAVVSPATRFETKSEAASVVETAPKASEPKAADAQVPVSGATKTQMFAQVMSSKPLLYCTALAAVLIAMSYFSRSAVKAFGPTAAEVTDTYKHMAKTTHVTPPTPSISKPTVSPRIASTLAVSHPASTAPVTLPIVKPTTVHPAAVADNTGDDTDTSISQDQDDNETATPAPTPKPVHRSRPRVRKTPRLVRASHRSNLRRSVRRSIRIRARQLSPRRRFAMLERGHQVRPHHRTAHAASGGIKIYDPQGRPLP